jgi:hypothetical protein
MQLTTNTIVTLREYQDALHYANKLFEYADILNGNPAVVAVLPKDHPTEKWADEAFSLATKLNIAVTEMEQERVDATRIKPKRKKRTGRRLKLSARTKKKKVNV